MQLRYSKADGTIMDFEIGDRPITIGRSPEADVVVLDEKASRIHCGVRLWDGDFYIKDLKSKNGTFVNDQRVEVQKLRVGDRVRVGAMTFSFEQEAEETRAENALQEVEEEFERGKGYTTLLREILDKSKELSSETVQHPTLPLDDDGKKPSEPDTGDTEL